MLERKVNVYLSAEEAVELGIADEIMWGFCMFDLRDIIDEEYGKKGKESLSSLLKMVEEVMVAII